MVRYLFWIAFCAFVSYALAGKANALYTPLLLIQVLAYGGIIGLSLAIGTTRKSGPRLSTRVIVSAIWLFFATTLYFLTFRQVSNGSNLSVVVLGLFFALPTPVVWIIQHKQMSKAVNS